MKKSTNNLNDLKEYLIKNEGYKLLDVNYYCSTYYNKHSHNLSEDNKKSLSRLINMQFYDPVQYMLSVKALLD